MKRILSSPSTQTSTLVRSAIGSTGSIKNHEELKLVKWWTSQRSHPPTQSPKISINSSSKPLVVLSQRGHARKNQEISSLVSHLLIEENMDPCKIQVIVPNYSSVARMEMILQDGIPDHLSQFANVRIDSIRTSADFIISEFGSVANLPEKTFELRRLSEQVAFLSKHVDVLKLPEMLRPKDSSTKSLSLVYKYLSSLKSAGISVEGYHELARKGYDTLGLAPTYEIVNKIKRSKGYFDGDDMVSMALEAINTLEARKYDLSSHFHGRRYGIESNTRFSPSLVIVDDIQDYSPLGARFIDAMLRITHHPHTRTIFVGNTDDAMRFRRGCSIDNFTFLCGGHGQNPIQAATKMIVSPDEESSHAKYLNTLSIRLLQKSNQEKGDNNISTWKGWGRYSNHFNAEALDKELRQQRGSDAVQLLHFKLGSEEFRYIADIVEGMRAEAEQNSASKSVLVVAPTVNDAEAILDAFEGSGLFNDSGIGLDRSSVSALSSDKRVQLFKTSVVSFLHNFMRLLVFPQDSRSLYSLLTSQTVYNMAAGEIAQIYAQSNAAHLPFRSVLFASTSPEIVRFFKDLNSLERLAASGADASQMVFEILNITGLGDRILGSDGENESRASYYVNEFLSEINRAMISAGTGALPFILEYIDVLIESGGVLVDFTNTGEDYDHVPIDREFEDHSDLFSLKVSTIRDVSSNIVPGSFDHVILPCLASNKYPSRRNARRLPMSQEMLNQPRPVEGVNDADGPFQVYEPLDRDDHVDEERSVLAKLLTIPKRNVMMSYSESYALDSGEGGGAAWLSSRRSSRPSLFLGEISRMTGVKINEIKMKSTSSKSRASEISIIDPEVQKEQAELSIPSATDSQYSLSFSRLHDIETCPKRYFLSRVVKLDAPSNPAMFLGKALHAAIAAHSSEPNEMKKFDQISKTYFKFWDDAFKMPDYDGQMKAQRNGEMVEGFADAAHVEEMKKLGFKKLTNYLKRAAQMRSDDGSMATKPPETLMVEHPFSFKHQLPSGESIQIVGILDKIEKAFDGSVTIVDYKTKIPDGVSNKDIRDGQKTIADSKKLSQLKSWQLQLTFYAWAYQKVFGSAPQGISIECITTGERLDFPLKQDIKEIESELNPRIQSALKIMQGAEFPANPSFMSCKFCSYRKACPESAM